MKQTGINVLLAITGIAGIAGLGFGIYGVHKANVALDAYAAAVNDVSGKVNIDPPAAVVRAATDKAMDKAISVIASAELQEAKKVIASAAANEVAIAVEEASKSIDLSTPEVKNQILHGVGEKVGDFILSRLKNISNVDNGKESTADIIRAAKEAGMTSWDIQRILEARQ